MKPFIYEISGLEPVQAFKNVCHLPYSLFLDSADGKHHNSRYSFVACYPIETIETIDGKTIVTNWEQRLSLPGDPFEILGERIKVWVENAVTIDDLPPFQGGAAGLFGYDLGRYIENLPQKALVNKNVPDMAVGIYDQVYAYDHKLKKGWILTHARNFEEAEKKRNFLISAFSDIEYKKNVAGEKLKGADLPAPASSKNLNWTPDFDEDSYIKQINKVINYIYEGDIFQANISRRFEAKKPDNLDPFEHYLKLREVNPAPYACYMNLGNIIISSASPERFLSVSHDGQVITTPIKGTRPHVSDIIQDRINREELLNSDKDRAENIMIVDLLRNDLSKVCSADSISANNLCELETFARVHHLVSTIRGNLKKGATALDLLKSCFPGGSITGAPKIRAMEIIEEIEPVRRGPYCGSISYIGFDGQMDSNILIRTLVYNGDTISFQTGGGIVADSDPKSEYYETIDKAKAIFESFESSKFCDQEDIKDIRVGK